MEESCRVQFASELLELHSVFLPPAVSATEPSWGRQAKGKEL